ncbi:hypothetical protein [Methylococcus mesophilus]|uniref:hypothetical protein n=1 Tax=Methylococcus mesophilus TaxID=2993564 RepID=UPI00224B5978|nr:hypothetical protein [Methylococcus mesophilus]UZR30205.1 hypothetical protein OOT43_06065 [Methylococcus mesophilus]
MTPHPPPLLPLSPMGHDIPETPNRETVGGLVDRVDLISQDLAGVLQRVTQLATEFPLETTLLISQVHLKGTLRRLTHVRDRFQFLVDDHAEAQAQAFNPREET